MTKRCIFTFLLIMFTPNLKILCHETAQNFLACENPLKRQVFYCPEREIYKNKSQTPPKKNKTCIFCKLWNEQNDKENLIVTRFEHNSVFLNRYPYNKGHLLVIPNRHIKNMDDLTLEEKVELIQIISKLPEMFKKLLGAEGANIGINIGKIGGASKPDHLHIHAIPRYETTNPNFTIQGFIQTAGETGLIWWNFDTLYDTLKPELDKLKNILKKVSN